MNVGNVNDILDNICDKIGTTAKMIVPEMAGYMIARWSILIVLAVIFLSIAGFLLCKCLKMRNESGKIVKLYLDKRTKEPNILLGTMVSPHYVYYTDEDYGPYIAGIVILSPIGFTLLCLGITKIIGWVLSPNAMTVMWIINNIGGNS